MTKRHYRCTYGPAPGYGHSTLTLEFKVQATNYFEALWRSERLLRAEEMPGSWEVKSVVLEIPEEAA